MVKGESQFDALKLLFEEQNIHINKVVDHEIIEVSSDHEADEVGKADKEHTIIVADDKQSEDNSYNSF